MLLAAPTVYIPTLVGGQRLAACLEALESQTVRPEVLVADNGPGDGCARLLAERFPDVVRISFGGKNLGFGAAMNIAVADGTGGPLIFLNDDTIPDYRFVESLLAAWNGGESAMVAGVLLRSDAPHLIDSAGVACDRTLTGWNHLAGQSVDCLSTAADPLGPIGGGALYDRTAFESVGGFDERLFLYYEDLDLALRLCAAGHRCRISSGALALHEGSATVGRRSAAQYYYTGFGRGYMLRKYGIMKRPSLAASSALSDSSAGLAQILFDRTAAGVRAKALGWRAARTAERFEPPLEWLAPPSFRHHTTIRISRRRA